MAIINPKYDPLELGGDAPATVRGTVLTGLSTATATPVTAADTVLVAAGKLQRQVTDNAAQLLPVRQKINPTWYQSGLWYGASYPLTANAATGTTTLGRATYLPMQILEDVTFNAIGLNVTTASAAGGTLMMGVFECLPDGSVGNTLFLSSQISAETTGSKEAALDLSFTAGVKIYVGYLSQVATCVLTTSLVSGFYSMSGAISTGASQGIGLAKSAQTTLGAAPVMVAYSASAATICLKVA